MDAVATPSIGHDDRKARIDYCIAAYPENELLILSEHSRSEQYRAENMNSAKRRQDKGGLPAKSAERGRLP